MWNFAQGIRSTSKKEFHILERSERVKNYFAAGWNNA
jgi:hypothetical protein